MPYVYFLSLSATNPSSETRDPVTTTTISHNRDWSPSSPTLGLGPTSPSLSTVVGFGSLLGDGHDPRGAGRGLWTPHDLSRGAFFFDRTRWDRCGLPKPLFSKVPRSWSLLDSSKFVVEETGGVPPRDVEPLWSPLGPSRDGRRRGGPCPGLQRSLLRRPSALALPRCDTGGSRRAVGRAGASGEKCHLRRRGLPIGIHRERNLQSDSPRGRKKGSPLPQRPQPRIPSLVATESEWRSGGLPVSRPPQRGHPGRPQGHPAEGPSLPWSWHAQRRRPQSEAHRGLRRAGACVCGARVRARHAIKGPGPGAETLPGPSARGDRPNPLALADPGSGAQSRHAVEGSGKTARPSRGPRRWGAGRPQGLRGPARRLLQHPCPPSTPEARLSAEPRRGPFQTCTL